jgi:predicted Rossmann fold nucleotide-binding protein DprA/Smf involved in DNA uptake
VLAALPLPLAPPRRRHGRGGARSAGGEPGDTARADDSPEVRRVLRALADGARDAAILADGLGLPPWQLLPLLTELELAGRIVQGADGYARARR